jgi:hypothetical protein
LAHLDLARRLEERLKQGSSAADLWEAVTAD